MEIHDTSGFYKYNTTDNVMVCGPHFVHGGITSVGGPGPYDLFTLERSLKDTYTYPVEGWYWFDSEEDAYVFFGIEWYPEIYTMGLPKPWLNNNDNNTTQ